MKQNVFTKVHQILGKLLFPLFLVLILTLSLRGVVGNPTVQDLNTAVWRDNGPLELSPERGRFALLYSLAENNSFQFTPDLARFVAPDVAYTMGHYVSLFAPGLSFIALPGYLLGKMFGVAQIGSFAMISLFAIANVYLIRSIAIRLGAHPLASTLAGVSFLFASPAFAYAVTLYQHHVSTFLILASMYLLLRFKNLWSLFLVWVLYGVSFVIDYPNLFLLLPIAVIASLRAISVKKTVQGMNVAVSFGRILAVIGVIAPLAFLLWFNKMSYGNPMQLSGTIVRAIEVKANGEPLLETDIIKQQVKSRGGQVLDEEKSMFRSFQNRNLMNGFYTHLISADRGMLVYTPIMFFGIVGLFVSYRRKNPHLPLFVGVIGFTLLLYSLWDDPYGGWAFGSRYMIPAYAMLSIFTATALTRFGRKNLFLLLFFTVLSYSISVNTLGAITTNSNPPKVEAKALETKTHTEEKYTYVRNLELLNANTSKSFFFNSYAGFHLSAWNYYIYLTSLIIIVNAFLLVIYRIAIDKSFIAMQKASRRKEKRIVVHGGTKQ